MQCGGDRSVRALARLGRHGRNAGDVSGDVRLPLRALVAC